MTREVEEDLRLVAVLGAGACARGHVVHGGEQMPDIRTEEDPHVARVVVPDLDEHLGHAARVVLGEAERLLSRSTDVVAHDDRVRARVGRRLRVIRASQHRAAEDRQAGQDQADAGGQRRSDAGKALHGLPPLTRDPRGVGTRALEFRG